MRLWHKDLIPYLPRQQLLGQWRECCCIAKNIKENGTPNHLLVNKIMQYDIMHFIRYASQVAYHMVNRGYKIDFDKFEKYFQEEICFGNGEVSMKDVFPYWHNNRYLIQCLFNLQEKYDCDGIDEDEWHRIVEKFGGVIFE